VQHAVAAANILGRVLREGRLEEKHLAQVQTRREWPTRVIQRIQLAVQNRVVASVLGATGPFKPPLAVRLIMKIPGLRQLPARLVGLGVRPEHVAPEMRAPRRDA